MNLIKCYNCGEYSTNTKVCSHCGIVFNKKEAELYNSSSSQTVSKAVKNKNKTSFYEKYRYHPVWIVRATAVVVNSIVIAFLAIGSFLAWLITLIAA